MSLWVFWYRFHIFCFFLQLNEDKKIDFDVITPSCLWEDSKYYGTGSKITRFSITAGVDPPAVCQVQSLNGPSGQFYSLPYSLVPFVSLTLTLLSFLSKPAPQTAHFRFFNILLDIDVFLSSKFFQNKVSQMADL